MEQLDPTCISPNASINRATIWDVPWLADDLIGITGYELLGRPFLVERVVARLPSLGKEEDPLIALDELCAAGHKIADEIAIDYGRRVAGFIHTLKHGSPKSRAARPQWNESYWGFWSGVSTIVLGGGIPAGHFGKVARDEANRYLKDCTELTIPSNSRFLALLGAATQRGEVTRPRVVLDVGNTSIKSGVAYYREGRLSQLQVNPVVSSPPFPPARLLVEAVVATVQRCIAAADEPVSETIYASVAQYIDRSGQPADYGYIGQLCDLAKDIPGLLSSAIRGATGLGDCEVILLHDGTAAAASFAGIQKSATIVLGTAVGFGIPPALKDSVIPITKTFELIRAC